MNGLPTHQIIIVPSNSGANIALFYKQEETARVAQRNIHAMQKGTVDASVLVVKDDFGHEVYIERQNISYSMFVDGIRAAALNPPKPSRAPLGYPPAGVMNGAESMIA